MFVLAIAVSCQSHGQEQTVSFWLLGFRPKSLFNLCKFSDESNSVTWLLIASSNDLKNFNRSDGDSSISSSRKGYLMRIFDHWIWGDERSRSFGQQKGQLSIARGNENRLKCSHLFFAIYWCFSKVPFWRYSSAGFKRPLQTPFWGIFLCVFELCDFLSFVIDDDNLV